MGVGASQSARYPLMAPNSKVLGGFPTRTNVTLKYVDVITMDAGSGSLTSVEFSARNMFDPDTRIGGHQPSNFDRWTTIYNRWTVVRTKVKFTPAWNSTSSVMPGFWGFLVSKTGSLVAGLNPNTLLEQPYVKYSDAGAGLANSTSLGGSLTATLPSVGWLGVNTSVLMSPDYSGDDSAGPALAQDFRVEFFVTNIAGNDPGSIPFKVEVEYDAVFYEPKITLPS